MWSLPNAESLLSINIPAQAMMRRTEAQKSDLLWEDTHSRHGRNIIADSSPAEANANQAARLIVAGSSTRPAKSAVKAKYLKHL